MSKAGVKGVVNAQPRGMNETIVTCNNNNATLGEVGVFDIKPRAKNPEIKQYDRLRPYSHPEDLYCFYPF